MRASESFIFLRAIFVVGRVERILIEKLYELMKTSDENALLLSFSIISLTQSRRCRHILDLLKLKLFQL